MFWVTKSKQNMANNRINMSKIRYILRLYAQGRSKNHISTHGGVSRNTLKTYIRFVEQSGMSLSELDQLTDKELDQLFTKPSKVVFNDKQKLLYSLFPDFDKQLKRKGMTRQILWEDYIKSYPDGYCRSQFNHHFRLFRSQVNPVMHIEHKAGDKLYVDFTGDKLSYVDSQTGEMFEVEIFVSILGASQLIYVEAVPSQSKEDLILATESALHYYGGVPAALVTDNLKSAVTKSSKYEPVLNVVFADFAHHYGFTILPTRAYKPRDKGIVESAVKIVYQRIYNKLRNQIFHSLEQLNAAIRNALEELNNGPLKGLEYSRRQQYEEIERQYMNALPLMKYEFKKLHYATVAQNGHVLLSENKHYYSVPYQYIKKKVKLLYTAKTVEIYYNFERIALHNRVKNPGGYTTDKEHMASTHKFVSEWTYERFMEWAHSIHEDVGLYIHKIFMSKAHPEQAFKSCMGVLSFAKTVGRERLTKACQRALAYQSYNYHNIERILKNGLDQNEDPADQNLPMPDHENIRGQQYYK